MAEPSAAPALDLKATLKKPIQWSLAATLFTALVTLFLPNQYLSEARLLPVESRSLGGNLGGLANAAAAFGVSVPGGDSSDANFVDILNSRSMREQLLQTEFQYHARTWRFGAERLEKGTLNDYLNEGNWGRSIRKLGTVVSASRDIKSKVISITAETNSPELSKLIVEKTLVYLEAFIKEKGRTRGGAKAVFAEARLADARREMDGAEEAWRRFLEVNRNYQSISDPSVRLKGARLENELRLRQQLVTTLAMNREQALLEEKNDIPILNVMDAADLPTEKSKPARSLIILAVAIFVAAGSWVWLNRGWVRAKLLAEDEEPDPSIKEHA
jgi:uncharacterized protein involved in exopolysaccharide biosynthesis